MNLKSSDSVLNRFFESRRFTLYAFLIIAGMTLLAYSNTFHNSFHFDDDAQISENPLIKQMSPDNIRILLRQSRPVVSLSLMMNYQLGGMNVVGYHIFNVTVHILNGFLVYLLVFRTLILPVFGRRYETKAARIALFSALLFAVHPIQTESVTYIIQRAEVLATLFYLATFLLFIKSVNTGKFGYSVAALFTSLLAMASKEWAVTLPAMLMLYDYLFLSDRKLKQVLARWKTYLLVMIPWLQIYRTTPLASSSGNAAFGFSVVSIKGISAETYLLTSANVIWTYIRLLFLPISQNLDYDYPVARTIFEFPTLLSIVGHIAVIAAAFWLYKKKRSLLFPFCVAWFYITLSPVQSFVPIIDVIFEHRVYLPSIGFFVMVALAYEKVFEWWESRKSRVTTTTA